jgi:DNA polymerase III subunit gamma/tau
MYRALYRKWRPASFDDVYGQNHITRTLKSEVESGRISHAYLFTGSRGTGKTTCAKILSKAVNCPHAVNGNPCNECEICKGIDDGSITDVIEIDAASNNGVDNIRDIREEVNYAPAVTKYRVYIIDEVHMLSSGAFNALLKTLEEPPAHVIFILATTDVQKLPATILSRCQRFDFKRIPTEDIIARLKFVAENEGVTINDNAAHLIAEISDGGMRDALSLMDSCLSVSNNITEDTVSESAGIAGSKRLFEFADYIAKEDFAKSLTLVSYLHSEACDISNICTGLSSHFRNLMIAKTVNNCDNLIICSKEELNRYKEQAEDFKLSKILNCIEILAKTTDSLKGTSNKKIQLESAVVKMCGVKNSDKGTQFYPAAEERIADLEAKINYLLANGVPAPQNTENFSSSQPKQAEKSDKTAEKIINPPVIDNNPIAKPAKESSPSLTVTKTDDSPINDGEFTLWAEVCTKVLSYDPPLFGILSTTSAVIRNNKIIILTDNPDLKKYLIENKRYETLDKSIQEVTGRHISAAIKVTGEIQKPTANKSPLEGFIAKAEEFNS